ncbi:hypothetical protein EUGRSUZ_H00738 [Eucalyptus grandis]|uniref:DOMON domain-containing protein n=2 Tax=Eucalyptus grandis TaxID=71139 RepID=A0A059AVY1_EUCGR|nr:hypothetical protein EUGRSUZ_H00738 [Eucalyptus grandis]
MASSSPPQPLLRGLPAAALLLLLLVLAPAADALACSSQNITNSTLYSTCLDLPTLSASLHFSYDRANSSAAVAFVAAPPKGEDGWVAWALNPTATGMFGAQALIAFRDAGVMTVKTYNITNTTVRESPISFETWDRAAEYKSADGTMRIYAKIKLPTGDPAKLNQVWQVGSSVTNGVPDQHAMAAENLGSKGTLDLVAGTGRSPAPAPTLVPTTAPTLAAPPPSGVSRIGEGSNGAFLVLSLAFLVSSFFGF